MFKKIIKTLTMVITFIFKNKDNAVAIGIALDIAEEIAKHTKTNMDNAALASIAAFIRNKTKSLTYAEKGRVAKAVTEKRTGSLKDVKLGFDLKKGTLVNTKFGDIKYNHNDGSFSWGKSLSF